jgi:hypothetical protein
MARSRDISKVLSSNSTLATDAEVAATYQTKSNTGLILMTPSSVSTTGGSASIASNGIVSFTSASAISLINTFTSSYNHYRIVINNIIGNAAGNINMRLRNSSGDITGTDYFRQYISAAGTSVAAARASSQTSWGEVSYVYNGYIEAGSIIEIMNTNLGSYTSAYSTSARNIGSNVEWIGNSFGCGNTNGPFTGFTLIMSSGAASGSVGVYAYNK